MKAAWLPMATPAALQEEMMAHVSAQTNLLCNSDLRSLT